MTFPVPVVIGLTEIFPAPAKVVFEEGGFAPVIFPDYFTWDDPLAKKGMRQLLTPLPDCVLLGISDTDAGSEKTAIIEASHLGIPTIAFVESWLARPQVEEHFAGRRDF